MEKPVTIILLNKHSSKTTLDDAFLCLLISALLIAQKLSLIEHSSWPRHPQRTTEESESTHP